MTRKILKLDEVAAVTGIPIATLRYLRSTGGNMPKTWKLTGRVVAFEDDVEAWVTEQYERTVA